jgi:plasmid stabilization system protein ParE
VSVKPGEAHPAIRERLIHRYRVIYRLDEARVLIVAVIHGRQDFGSFVARIQSTEI